MRPRTAAAPLVLLLAACAGDAGRAAAVAAGDPMTPKRPVVETYHGVEVADDYRWLEDGAAPEVRAWSDAQNERTRRRLDALPGAEALRRRLASILRADGVSYRRLRARGGRLFALEDRRPRQQAALVVMDAAACDPSRQRVLVDPTAIDPKGLTTIDWYVPSHDGRRVAVSMSARGTESGTLRVFDVASGARMGPPIERVHGGTAGGSVAWNHDASGFWYTRYPAPGERPAEDLAFWQQVWFHRLGTGVDEDRCELGPELPRIAEVSLDAGASGHVVLAEVKNGDGGEHAHWVRVRGAGWRQVTRFEDEVVRAAVADDGDLVLLSRKPDPRGRILVLDPARDLAEARVLVAAGERAIERFVLARDRVCVIEQTGGAHAVRVVPRAAVSDDGTPRGAADRPFPLPHVAAVDEIVPLGSPGGGSSDDDVPVLVRTQGYTTPPRWVRVDLARAGGVPEGVLEVPLCDTTTVDLSDAECVQEWAVSKDGTRVPFVVVRRRGAPLDGNAPALLTGYGGYGISMTPRFRPSLRVWLDHGGVYAVASVRGGGEFGEDWHRAGNLTRKQNVFDDFAACARRLAELGYTRPERLAIEGGSNGGLLVAATMVQDPGLCRAVVAHVGLYDMLRVETTPNGAFNVTEFGTVKDPEQFRALHAYSPYHRVADGVRYPSVLFLTGANDPRVDPYHSRKMTARLLAARPADAGDERPVLLRTSSSSGHGMGSSLDERVAQAVDVHAFLFHELGVAAAAE